MRGLTALLGCFNADIYTTSSGRHVSTWQRPLSCYSPRLTIRRQYFLRSPAGNDWDRFVHHARRVRILLLGQDSDELRALQILELCRPDQSSPLLPNLRDLLWCDLKPSGIRYLNLFVHPGLVTFSALVISNPLLLSDIFTYLAQSAPGLRHLRISPGIDEHRGLVVLSALTKLLQSLTGLKELSLKAPVCTDTLSLLAQLPRLEVLSARVPSHLIIPSRNAAGDLTRFPSLRKLTIHAEQLDDVVFLLDIVESDDLHELVLQVNQQPTKSSLEQFFSCATRHRSLQILNIMIIRAASQSPASHIQKSAMYVMGTSSIRKLFRLTKLSHLILPQMPIEVDDQLLYDAASAWPHIRRLCLGTMARLDNTDVSLNAIRWLITSCKNISELALAFNPSLRRHACSEREAGRITNTAQQDSHLRRFDIGCSPIHDMSCFANFIVENCPDAHICDPHGPAYRKASMSLISMEVNCLKAANLRS